MEAMLAMALAEPGELISINQIGEQTALSESYLEQIFSLLKKAGLVESVRGNKGGYRLSVPADQITAGSVLRAAEGSLAPVRCTQKNDPACSNRDLCLTLPVWQLLEQAISEHVDAVTLSELCHSFKSGNYDYGSDYNI
jgi:Rrf2 family protein